MKRSKREFFSARENLAEIIEEIREKTSNSVIQSEEFGEILLRLVAVANIFGINAEFSLTNALEAFINSDSMDSELPNGSH
ncbi:MAG: hypothetical protein LBI27_08295 [Clostridiales bacterium]|nr:hypothetical protein [Clostridiales bacterium]